MTNHAVHVPFNDLTRYAVTLWERASPRLSEVVESGWVVLGSSVGRFERRFAEYVGTGETVGVANGTDGLELALRSVGVGPLSKVATTANAGFYTSTAIRAIGAEPVYIDVADEQASPNAEQFQAVLAAGDLSALVLTHLYGRVVPEVEAISDQCRQAGVALIEDCSQAHGARRRGRHVGTFGDVGVFSLYPTKNLGALGDGGAVCTTRTEVADAVRELRQYGWGRKYVVERAGGRNSRLDELQAALLDVALDDLDNRNERRREIIDEYRRHIPNCTFMGVDDERSSWVGHLCVLAVDERDDVRAALVSLGVATDVHFPVPDHLQPVWGDRSWAALPNTERLAKRVLSVPCFPDMTDAEVDHVATALRATLE